MLCPATGASLRKELLEQCFDQQDWDFPCQSELDSIFTDQSARCLLDQSNCRDLELYTGMDHSGTRGRASSRERLMLGAADAGSAPSAPQQAVPRAGAGGVVRQAVTELLPGHAAAQ